MSLQIARVKEIEKERKITYDTSDRHASSLISMRAVEHIQ